jgi:hypothetical protein
MFGIKSQTIDEDNKSNQERKMNKLSQDNEVLFTDATADDHPEGRIGRLKDGDFCENLREEDDADQKSITLEALKEQSKTSQDSQRDRDYVSESSLTIVSDSDLFQENSRWLSMSNSSSDKSNMANNSNLNISTNATNANTNRSSNDINNHVNNNMNNTPTTKSSNNNNSNSISNHFYNTATRRRSSLISDITFEYDDQTDDIDVQTTDSNDSRWANNSGLLSTARRFAPNYIPGGNNNETIEEEHHDYHEKLKQGRDNCATTAAPVIPRRRISASNSGQTAAPVIPRRRISASNSGQTYSNHTAKSAAAAAAGDFERKSSKMTQYNIAAATRVMARGNAAAPTIPKRTSSHHSNLPSIKKNNAKVYQMYNASFSSIVDSQVSHDTEPSFFEDGSTAAAAAAAYLSSSAMVSQQEEVRTVQTAITSHTNDTPVLTNHGVGRRLSREEAPIEAETPPILPERRGSNADIPLSFAISSSFKNDEDEIPSVVHEEEPRHSTDSAAAHPTNTKTTSHAQPPSIPLWKNLGSQWSSGNSKSAQHSSSPSRLNTQPPTCPMRKNSNHCHAKVVSQDPSLVQQGQHPSHKHNKPPTKPMRTNSISISRSSTSATLSS